MTPEEQREYRRQVCRRSYEKNLERIKAKRIANREKMAAYGREYREKYREEMLAEKRAYSQRPEIQQRRRLKESGDAELKAYKSAWHKAHPRSAEKVAIQLARRRETGWDRRYIKRREASDPNFKLKRLLRARLKESLKLKGQAKTGSHIRSLGCSVDFLKSYLESKFKPGMLWSNWCLRGWHVDHIKPLASFDLTDPAQLAEACHYTNLQPLWAKENIRKGAKV